MKYTGNEVCPKCGSTGPSDIASEVGIPKISASFIAATETVPEHMQLQCRVCSYGANAEWTAEPKDAA